MDAVGGTAVVTLIKAAASATAAGSADALPVVDAQGFAVIDTGPKDIDAGVGILTAGSTVGTAMTGVGSVRCASNVVVLAAYAEVAGIAVVAFTMGFASVVSGAGNAADGAFGGSSATGTDAGGIVDIFSGSDVTDADAGAGTVGAFDGSAASGTDTGAGIVGTTPAITGVPPSRGSEGASKDSTMVGITTELSAHGSADMDVVSAGAPTFGAVSDSPGGCGSSRGPIWGAVVVTSVVAVMGAAVAVASGHSHSCNSGGHSQAPLTLSPNVFASPSTRSCHAAGLKSMSADAFKEVLATSATTGIADMLASALWLHGATSRSTPMFTLHPTVISTSVIVR